MRQSRDRSMSAFPAFEPHPLLRNAHAQTIAGRYLPGRRIDLPYTTHELPLPDGDRLCVFESIPTGWTPGAPVVLLVHGLGGCARARYVTRVAERLFRLGQRCVRMNLRGAGAGFGLARGIYHSGRTEDVRAVAEWLAGRAPGSPLALLGFSLGANLVLKLAAEAAAVPLAGLDCVVAANPPLDLAACCRAMREPRNQIYNRNFVKSLRREVARLHARFPDLPRIDVGSVTSVYEFDDRYTAPRNGFASADDYYARCSAGPLVGAIPVPGLVVHAADDPFIPVETVARAPFPPHVELRIEARGGHLGFLSAQGDALDRRWLDAALAWWLQDHWRNVSSGSQDTATPSTAHAFT
jgi:predicted alpha/beta-fold hydrolase